MELPHVFVFEGNSEDDAAIELARRLDELRVREPFVLASSHGERVAAKVSGPRPSGARPLRADQAWAARLGSEARRSGADAIVAVGGGRLLDVAKLAAARAGLKVVAAPTQLSHDGICSPVAVVPDPDGTAESLGAIPPLGVFVSLPTIHGAPETSVAAGIGDLLANPLALRDWRLAAERGLSELDDRGWDLSVESHDSIRGHLGRDLATLAKDPDFLRRLADALMMSGMAMIEAGTSRPASGGEHEVSHAIDELFGGRAMHGAQVAFGCIVSTALYSGDVDEFVNVIEPLGLPTRPEDLGLSEDEVVRVILHAPNTRPGRFTILEDTDLDESRARELVLRLWR